MKSEFDLKGNVFLNWLSWLFYINFYLIKYVNVFIVVFVNDLLSVYDIDDIKNYFVNIN